MATHKTLETMVEVAQNKGVSKRKSWEVSYTVMPIGGYDDLGFKKVEKKEGLWTVYHYGTIILQIRQTGNLYTGHNYTVDYVYGISKSDADAINALLEYFGIYSKQYTYKPVNGGFQEVQ